MGDPPEKVMLAARTLRLFSVRSWGSCLRRSFWPMMSKTWSSPVGSTWSTIDVETSDLWDSSGSVLRKSLIVGANYVPTNCCVQNC